MSRGTREPRREFLPFRLPDCHRLWSAFPGRSTRVKICNSLTGPYTCMAGPTTPDEQRAWAYIHPVWADPVSLAATQGIAFAFSSSGYLDVSVPPVSFPHLCIQHGMTPHDRSRVSPFGNLRVKACLAAYRSLSQLTTPFIASWRQGIHRTPLIA